mgnify:CR=1 FL=1
MKRNPFATYHPAVAFVFLACAIVISMAALQPVFVALSFLGALACSVVCRGARATAGSFVWIVPLWLVVAIANPLFSASGSSEILRIGVRAVYVESLVYGACSGGMLASVFLWFSSYAACMNSANTMALFGNVLPIVSLMVSQVMRLVPQFVARGRGIAAAQDAVSAAAPQTKRQQTAGRLRIVSVLMGWGMEDGIERSDAMRARGYDCGARRTTYKRYRFGRADASVLAAIVVLAAVAGACAAAVCLRFSFYPTLSGWGAWWAYLPYALLMAVPSALRFKEWLLWRS